jgi:hypothetical protein
MSTTLVMPSSRGRKFQSEDSLNLRRFRGASVGSGSIFIKNYTLEKIAKDYRSQGRKITPSRKNPLKIKNWQSTSESRLIKIPLL